MVRALRKAAVLSTGIAVAMAMSITEFGPAAQAVTVKPAAVGVTTTLDAGYWASRKADTSSRLCSTQVASNVAAQGSELKLTVRKVTSGADYKAIAAKALKAKKKKKINKVCPSGVFTSGMASTGSAFSMKYGKVEARVKFPVSQGMHAGIWLKSTTSKAEIDMIEGFGHGYGLTSTVWSPSGKKYDSWVLPSAAKKRSWWGQYHTASVVWGPNAAGKTVYRFTLDGKKSRPDFVSNVNNGQSYEIVVSNLSSDWELPLLKKPTKKRGSGVKKGSVPSTFVVAWVKATPSA